jgi:hypothetical protein
MLRFNAPEIQPTDGVLRGRLDKPESWPSVPITLAGVTNYMQFMGISLGDPESGPVVHLNAVDRELHGPAHHHRTDTFRMPLMPGIERQLRNGPHWLSRGDYVLMRGNVTYAESSGGPASWFLVDADRRGSVGEEYREIHGAYFGKDNLPSRFYDADEEAVIGATTTMGVLPTKGKLIGSVDDTRNWTDLSDGSTVLGVLMADAVSGPLVVISHNVPNAEEAPAGSYTTDTFRFLIAGECTIGDHTCRADDFVASEAGTVEGPVRHGPDGSTQVILYADRRGRLPQPVDGSFDLLAAYPRLAEIEAAIQVALDNAA